MKVAKYPQSHLVISNDLGKKLIIDPGYLTYKSGFKVSDFQGADVYLITHQHSDHLDPETIKEVVKESPVYGNTDVVTKLKGCGVKGIEIEDQQEFTVAGFVIRAIDIPHFKKPGVEMPPNTGYLIQRIFFHPGDGWNLHGVSSPNAAVPISGPPEGEIGFTQALTLAKSLGAKTVIPIHYDLYQADVTSFSEIAQKADIRVIPLSPGQETTI
ncbi:MBL fold metallo-hydrolase [Candidatus Microgenomates bacterium]|nr:MBL fold metallo-hydrolase [Candidatus Microgenomates bacterium]